MRTIVGIFCWLVLGAAISVGQEIGVEVLRVGENEVELSWGGAAGGYQVQRSSDLSEWTDVGPVTAETTATVDVADADGAVFFRIVTGIELEANYRVTFSSLWQRSRFSSVPGGDHFSGMVGASHDTGVSFWSPGDLATTGIEQMAETGSKSALLLEVEAAITAGTADGALSGGGLGAAGSSASSDFTVRRSHPLVTLVSMIAPSPDWFVGVHGETLLDEAGGWKQQVVFDLLPYDAGTDDGQTFTSANAESQPHVGVFPLREDSHFALRSGEVGEPVLARFVFERTD